MTTIVGQGLEILDQLAPGTLFVYRDNLYVLVKWDTANLADVLSIPDGRYMTAGSDLQVVRVTLETDPAAY